MAFKYSIKSFHPSADVRPWSGKDLKDDKDLLNRLVELWVQLDDAEDDYDKPFGLRMPDKKGIEEFFRSTLLKRSGYAVYEGDVVVGFCIIRDAEYENSYFISTLVVDSAYRGKHYGKTLMDYVLNTARKGQHALLRVSMNNKAGLALYKKCGFVPMSQVMIRK